LIETCHDRVHARDCRILHTSAAGSNDLSQQGATRSDANAILQTDAAYREAVLKADTESLKNLLANDIVIVHSDGTTDTRTNFLDAIASGRLKMRSYQRTKVEVRIHGSTAVILSETTKTFDYKGTAGRDDDTSVVTYANETGRWHMVAMQNTHRSN
jgi:ketosteroid isomerase-like protein